MAKFYIKVTDVELGVELDMEELVTFGEAFSEALTPELIDKFEALLTKAKTNPVKKEEPEEGPVKAEDLLDEEKEAAIQKLKDLGCSVKKEEEDVYECKTNSIWDDKYALVKAWLKDHGIKYEEKLNSCYRKVIYYDLCMTDLENMIDWLDDHGDKIDTTIEI